MSFLRSGGRGVRWLPFVEWRPNEIGLGFSLSVDREWAYGLGVGKSAERVWCPNIWVHVGPVIAGIGWST